MAVGRAANLAPHLRCVVFVGETPLGQALDLKRVRLRLVGEPVENPLR